MASSSNPSVNLICNNNGENDDDDGEKKSDRNKNCSSNKASDCITTSGDHSSVQTNQVIKEKMPNKKQATDDLKQLQRSSGHSSSRGPQPRQRPSNNWKNSTSSKRKNSIGTFVTTNNAMTSSSEGPAAAANNGFTMGIDLGTTSVKVCLLSQADQAVSDLHVKETLAYVPSDCGSARGDQQDPSRIYSALHACLTRVPKERLKRVVRVAFSGQMHGVMFWKSGRAWKVVNKDKSAKMDILSEGVSSVYTWQDSRCDQDFIRSLPEPRSHLKLATGYGCATIFWLQKNRPDFLAEYDCCGTVMDFVVAMITQQMNTAKMSNHNAASWGYFDTVGNSWNKDILEKEGFPVQLLPEVVMPGTDVGNLRDKWFEIPVGTPVSVALGDLQCSVMSTLENAATDVVMNISTSAQMAFVLPKGFRPDVNAEKEPVIEYLPYLDGHYIATAAALTGGNALAAFVKMIQRWVVDLGLSIPQSKIWEKTLALGMAAAATNKAPTSDDSDSAESNKDNHATSSSSGSKSAMDIVPRLYGERHAPEERASAANICAGNLSLGQVTRSVCLGIVTNMAEMMPPEVIHEAGMKRIVGSGAGLCRNPILKSQVQDIYKLPVEFVSEANACIGAALAVSCNSPDPSSNAAAAAAANSTNDDDSAAAAPSTANDAPNGDQLCSS